MTYGTTISHARSEAEIEEMKAITEMENKVKRASKGAYSGGDKPIGSPIQNEIDRTHKMAAVLNERLVALMQRLDPVLLAPAPSKGLCGSCVPHGDECPLSSSVARIGDALDNAFNALGEIENRLAL